MALNPASALEGICEASINAPSFAEDGNSSVETD
jgi:hypothetical protein